MAKHFTAEEQKTLCEEFLSSNLTRILFCKNKSIGLSTLTRWLHKYRVIKKPKDTFKQIHARYTKEFNCLPERMLQMILPNGIKIYLYREPVDIRKSINSLSVLVVEFLKLSPNDGSVYIFYNKAIDRLKILFYDRNGFVLYYKILDKKKFNIIKTQELMYRELTAEQLDWLLAGLDLEAMQQFPEIKYRYFF